MAFGDKPGTEDMGLFMQCCRADGKILKPSRAISAIDAQIRGMGANIKHTTGPAKVRYFNLEKLCIFDIQGKFLYDKTYEFSFSGLQWYNYWQQVEFSGPGLDNLFKNQRF